MKYNPHNYQLETIEYIKNHTTSAIFLDMGLGKTSITLTALNDLLFDSFDVHRVLVIAPLRVARDTWKNECLKWDHLKNLEISVIVGNAKQRLDALNKRADIYIINRDNIKWLVEKSDKFEPFDTIVIDELSSFKNARTQRFRSYFVLRMKAKRAIGLTGTPSPNGYMDLWAEFKALDKGVRLGRFITEYRNNYFVPDKRSRDMIYSYQIKSGCDKLIKEKIKDITISLKAKDHIVMPELIISKHSVYLTKSELGEYSNFADNFVMEMKEAEKNDEITAKNAGVLYMKLSQLANGCIYDDEKEIFNFHNHKLEALEDIIESMNGRPMLLAYWYKHDLRRIEEKLKELKVNYEKLDKEEAINKWCEGKLAVGLIHPQSAGHGLNLQDGGNTIVWYSIPWSLELYQQTNGRLYRQGQKSNVVIVQHIITEGTVDNYILEVLKHKDAVQEKLIEAVKLSIKK